MSAAFSSDENPRVHWTLILYKHFLSVKHWEHFIVNAMQIMNYLLVIQFSTFYLLPNGEFPSEEAVIIPNQPRSMC